MNRYGCSTLGRKQATEQQRELATARAGWARTTQRCCHHARGAPPTDHLGRGTRACNGPTARSAQRWGVSEAADAGLTKRVASAWIGHHSAGPSETARATCSRARRHRGQARPVTTTANLKSTGNPTTESSRARTAAGHRLYTADDVARGLYRISLLRRLRLSARADRAPRDGYSSVTSQPAPFEFTLGSARCVLAALLRQGVRKHRRQPRRAAPAIAPPTPFYTAVSACGSSEAHRHRRDRRYEMGG